MWYFYMLFNVVFLYVVQCGIFVCCSMWYFYMLFNVVFLYVVQCGIFKCCSMWYYPEKTRFVLFISMFNTNALGL